MVLSLNNRWVRRLLLAALAALAVLMSGCSSLYFYPMKPWVQNPAHQGLDYQDVILIQPGGLRLDGWWLPAEGKPRGTVYYLHGNAQNISTHLANVQWLPSQGYNVFLLDYRGFGLSEGSPDLSGALSDIQLGLDWLERSGRLNGKPLVLFGQSLGASMSVDVLSRPENKGKVDCVMLEAGFASYRDIADTVMSRSWLLWPFQWLVNPALPDRSLDPVNRIAALAPRPLLVMHSEDDPVVPFASGKRLYAAAGEPKQFIALHGGHAEGARDPVIQQRMLNFLDDHGCMAHPGTDGMGSDQAESGFVIPSAAGSGTPPVDTHHF